MTSDPMTRRSLLRAFAVGGTLASIGGAGYLLTTVDDTPTSTTRTLSTSTTVPLRLRSLSDPALTDDEKVLVAIGRRYLQDHPDEASSAVLYRHLPEFANTTPVDPVATLRQLQQRVRDDFEHQRVVSVDGWLLAQTEARAAALYALPVE